MALIAINTTEVGVETFSDSLNNKTISEKQKISIPFPTSPVMQPPKKPVTRTSNFSGKPKTVRQVLYCRGFQFKTASVNAKLLINAVNNIFNRSAGISAAIKTDPTKTPKQPPRLTHKTIRHSTVIRITIIVSVAAIIPTL